MGDVTPSLGQTHERTEWGSSGDSCQRKVELVEVGEGGIGRIEFLSKKLEFQNVANVHTCAKMFILSTHMFYFKCTNKEYIYIHVHFFYLCHAFPPILWDFLSVLTFCLPRKRGKGPLVISHKCRLMSWLILAPRPPMHFLHKTFPGTSNKISHCAKFHGSSCLIS